MNINVCFHGIGTCTTEREPGESRYWMARETFLEVLDAVQELSYVRLSFDDGNKSDLEIALPALRDRGLTATFFALAGRLEDPVSLSAADLRELRAAGMTVGSHGWHHVPWRGLTDVEARRELVDAREALEEASGAPVTTAALPLGRYDRATLRRLRQAGYQSVFTSDRFPARDSSWLQARYSVTSDDAAMSVHNIARRRPGRLEARNLLASSIKRLR